MRSYRRLPLGMTGVLVLLVAVTCASVAFAAESSIVSAPPIPKGYTPYVPPPPPVVPPTNANTTGSATQSVTPKRNPNIPAGTQPYNMDFTLPTLGKAGCMVCHGDRNLIRIRGDQYVSFYLDDAVMRGSAHGPGQKTGPNGVMCTACHLDFAYKAPHKSKNDWRKTGKLACKNCHQTQYDAFSLGSHAVSDKPGQVDPKADAKPLCGDCHGAHDIKKLTGDQAAQVELHAAGYRVCGRCHQKEWDSYGDYYHGAAYRRGAKDAPACWDCHGSHTILPSGDRRSPTSEDRIVETCGGAVAGRSCHEGVSESFVSYSGLIHKRTAALEENRLYAVMQRTREGISAALSNIVGAVRSWFTT